MSSQCYICQLANVKVRAEVNYSEYSCGRCGKYRLTSTAISIFAGSVIDAINDKLYLLSGHIRNNTENNLPVFVADESLIENKSIFIEKIISFTPKTIEAKKRFVLGYLAKKTAYPGQKIIINPEMDYSVGYCQTMQEFKFFLRHIKELQFIESSSDLVTTNGTVDITLTAKGLEYIEMSERGNPDSHQAFVAMSFNDAMLTVFADGIAPLKKDTGFDMIRVDSKEYNDKICDKIVSEIRRSRFLIAEVTGQNQGVYFEAGYAMGLGIPVIWTCNAKEMDNLHFDTRQYNHILWKDISDLKNKLKDRILATIGQV